MSEITTAAFLAKATHEQFTHVLQLYDEALRIKAEAKSSKKPQELIKLDKWYQEELPQKIKSRLKDPHITHDELVNCMRWKLARGKFRPRLKELVTMNSPRVVETESRKAFRALFKKDDLAAAVQYLCNLKGIGPATASALLTAAAPQIAAYMADEVLAAVPEIEGIDYTLQEYLEMLKHIRQAALRLEHERRQRAPTSSSASSEPSEEDSEMKSNADSNDGSCVWTPHQIELALWTHHVLLTHRPQLLRGVGTVGGPEITQPESEGEVEKVEKDSEGKSTAGAAPQRLLLICDEEDGNSNFSSSDVLDSTTPDDSCVDDSNSADGPFHNQLNQNKANGRGGLAASSPSTAISPAENNSRLANGLTEPNSPPQKRLRLDEDSQSAQPHPHPPSILVQSEN